MWWPVSVYQGSEMRLADVAKVELNRLEHVV